MRPFLGVGEWILVFSLFLTSPSFTVCNVGIKPNFTLAVLTVSFHACILVQISLLNSVHMNTLNSLWDVATRLQTWHMWVQLPATLQNWGFLHSFLSGFLFIFQAKRQRIIFYFSFSHILHIHSPRSNKSFVKMNQGSISLLLS